MATTQSSDGNVVGVVWRSSPTGGEAVVGVSSSGTSGAVQRPLKVGSYYSSGNPGMTSGTSARNAGDLLAVPFYSDTAMPIDRIGLRVTTLQALGVIRIGAHAMMTSGLPGALLFTAGTVDASTTGDKQITVTQTLPAGWCFLTALFEGASGIATQVHNAASGFGSFALPWNGDFAPNFSACSGWLKTGVATGSLPTPFPTVASASDEVNSVPLMLVRAA